MAEFQGMSIDEFNERYPESEDQGQGVDTDNNQDQGIDASPESSPADFENPNGQPDDTMQYGEYQENEGWQEPEPQQTAKDIPSANLKGEYYRKLREVKAMEENLRQQGILEQQPQSDSSTNELSQQDQQVELPPQQQYQSQQQYQQQTQQWQPQQPQPQQIPTPEQLGIMRPEKLETVGDFEQLARYVNAQDAYKIRQEARQEAVQVIQQQQTEQRILSDYPDMVNPASPLFQWTQYELQTRYNGNPQMVEEATMRAAARIGVQPKSRQTVQSQSQAHPQQKPLPRIAPQAPAAERATPQRQQGTKVKLSPETLRAAKLFGQNPKDLEAMIKRQKYGFATGQSIFEE